MLRVLLVEDSRLLTERLREVLAQIEDVEIVGAVTDELAAVEAIRQNNVDLVILDLQLRLGTGFGVVEKLGKLRPVIVVFTNYDLPEYQRRAAALGIEHYLNTSRDYERLPLLVQELGRRLEEMRRPGP